jgi:uncharacterized membrane protein
MAGGMLTVPAAAADEMAAEEMLMSVMGGGVEDLPEATATSLDAWTLRAAESGGVQTIDVPGAVATRAFGINPSGDVVGSYTDATGTWGYLWSDGEFTRIVFPGARHSEAWGINPRGDIVGRYLLPNDPGTYGFLLRDGVYKDISVAGRLHTLPIKIGPSGVVVGCVHGLNFLQDMRGYVQDGTAVTLFEPLPSTMHNGVARSGGVIAGISFDAPLVAHSYVIDKGNYTQFDYPGQTFTQAWDVSPSGTVVGYFDPFFSHGFARDADGIRQIDVPGARLTRIFGINPQEHMVGVYADETLRFHGFVLRN